MDSQTEQSLLATIAKLKEENNHLMLELKYERSMRAKFEEETNRLHFVKIGKLVELDFLMMHVYF